MNLKIIENSGIIHPPQKKGDAGFDIVAKNAPRVIGSIYQGLYYSAISHIEYDTEIQVEPEKARLSNAYDFFLLLYPRSSIINTNLVLSNSVGIIDSGYRGNIKVCFKYICQPEDMKIIEGKNYMGKKANGILTSINPQRIYQQGDKIAQLVPCKHNNMTLKYTKSLNPSERNDGGFGSTGK